MKKVVFVAPYFLPATLRFVAAAARLEDVALGLISCEPVQKLPREIRDRTRAYCRIANCLDPGQLAVAAKDLARQLGGLDRLFGALEELQVPLGQVREYLGVEGIKTDAARNFREKSRMKDVLQRRGVPCARHCLAGRAEEAWRFVETVGYPLVVKPPAGAGARNTFQVDGDGMLRDYLAAFAPTPQRPALLEEFIRGEEHSFEAVSIRGKVVWHSLTHYYPGPLEVLENPWIQWCVLLPREIDAPIYDDIRRANRDALAALGMQTGISHTEWFRRADGSVAISEVGARPPGAQIMSLTSYAHDKDLYKAWAELMVFDRFEPPARRYAAGAAFLRGQGGRGVVKAVRGLNQAQREVGSIVIEARLPQPGQPAATGYEGEGYVIVRHPDTDTVKRALRRLVSLIRVEYG